MKPFRTLLATALTAGALVVIPAETASACVLGLGTDCPIGTREPRLHKTDTGNFGVRLEPVRDPNAGAHSPTVPNNGYCWPWDPCTQQVQPHQSACWFCESSKGVEGIQRKVNQHVADQQQPAAQSGCGFGCDPNWQPSW